MSGYSTLKIVRSTTASALTVEQWQRVWELAAPVIVAAGRFLDVEQEGNPKLTLDAHFQLLKAVTSYRHAGAMEE
jgi:hypothetical protein